MIEMIEEGRVMLRLAAPIMASSSLSYIMNMVDLSMVGHLGREELAAASLGTAFYMTVFFPLNGVAMALDTLFSQSYGAKNFHSYALWLLVGCVSMTCSTLPVIVILLFTDKFLIAMGMEEHLSHRAATFVHYLLPGMLPNILYIVFTKYLQSQHILSPCVWISALSNLFNIIVNYVLIYSLGWGFVGAPVATTLSRIFQFLGMIVFLLSSSRHSRTSPSKAIAEEIRLHHFKEFFLLGFAGWLMIALEAWAFDVGSVLAGYLGAVSLDAHASLQNISGFTYMSLPLAMSIAVSIRVGNLLGEGKGQQARTATRVTLVITISFMASLAITYLIVKDYIGYLFSKDEEVVSKAASLVPILALFQVFDGCQTAIAGSFRGMGRQKLVAWLNFLGFWLIGQSLGISLTFFIGGGIGVYGLWWGLAAGLGCTSCIGGFLLSRVDWEEEARVISARSAMKANMSCEETHGELKKLEDELAIQLELEGNNFPAETPTKSIP